MNTSSLGSGQLLFVRNRHAIEIDLLLAGPGTIEGRPLVPGSPVAASLVAPSPGWARRRLVQRLRDWADAALRCEADIEISGGRAVLVLARDGRVVRAPLTDLDVLFADDATTDSP